MRVLYPGGFDLLHSGHTTALRTARRIASHSGWLVVAVNSDAFMSHYKRTPARTEQQRVADVTNTGIADEVIIWDGPTGQDRQILALEPDIYVAGTNWLGEDLAAQLGLDSLEWFDEHTISLLFLQRTPNISTTKLIQQRKA